MSSGSAFQVRNKRWWYALTCGIAVVVLVRLAWAWVGVEQFTWWQAAFSAMLAFVVVLTGSRAATSWVRYHRRPPALEADEHVLRLAVTPQVAVELPWQELRRVGVAARVWSVSVWAEPVDLDAAVASLDPRERAVVTASLSVRLQGRLRVLVGPTRQQPSAVAAELAARAAGRCPVDVVVLADDLRPRRAGTH